MRLPVFAANWKMNKAIKDTAPFVSSLIEELKAVRGAAGKDFEVVIGPSATHLPALMAAVSGKPYQAASQNCGHAKSGAFTGEVSPAVLKELGVTWAILGHSERRHVYGETNERVLSRVKAALEEGLNPILCVGETLEQRRQGKTMAVVEEQLAIVQSLKSVDFSGRFVLAYEPVWAIGTGENATPKQAQEVHAFIRQWLGKALGKGEAEKTRILYGGSVKPENSLELMKEPDVDGFLIGGASLEANSFAGIIKNAMIARS